MLCIVWFNMFFVKFMIVIVIEMLLDINVFVNFKNFVSVFGWFYDSL